MSVFDIQTICYFPFKKLSIPCSDSITLKRSNSMNPFRFVSVKCTYIASRNRKFNHVIIIL